MTVGEQQRLVGAAEGARTVVVAGEHFFQLTVLLRQGVATILVLADSLSSAIWRFSA